MRGAGGQTNLPPRRPSGCYGSSCDWTAEDKASSRGSGCGLESVERFPGNTGPLLAERDALDEFRNNQLKRNLSDCSDGDDVVSVAVDVDDVECC